MSFFTKKLKPQPHSHQQPAPLTHEGDNSKDLEEDGFVLVGQTEDERNAITPDKHNSEQDLPPMYQFSENGRQYNPAQHNAPTYENYSPTSCNARQPTSQSSQNQSTPSSSSQGQLLTHQSSSISLHGQNPTAKSPLHDIPFKLDDSVACAFNYGQFNVDIGDEFSWSTAQYHYDFTTERSVVQQTEPL